MIRSTHGPIPETTNNNEDLRPSDREIADWCAENGGGIPATTAAPIHDRKASEVIEDLMMVRLVADDKDHPAIDAAVAENERLRKALEWIAQPRYGLDINDGPDETAEYWARLATEYRAVARRALGLQP